jgi:hypothetical protein
VGSADGVGELGELRLQAARWVSVQVALERKVVRLVPEVHLRDCEFVQEFRWHSAGQLQ